MGSRWGGVLLILVVAALSLSCGRQPLSDAVGSGGGDEAIEIKDDAGRIVRLSHPAARIVSLAPSNTELVFAIGGAGKLVGVDDYSDFPAEAKTLEKVGGFGKINLEQVVSMTPDLVLATNIHEKAIVPELQQRGIPVAIIQPKKVIDILASVAMVGKLIGRESDAVKLSQGLQSRLEAVTSKTKSAPTRPRVYFELDTSLFTAGPDTFVDDLLLLAGGRNIASDATTQWPQLSAEAVLTKDPEVIILSDYGQADAPEKVKARPGWQSLSAVKNNRVVKFNADYANRPGPRVFDGLDELARLLQPELFR